jgi:uncharacterized membrane protein YjjP (DUF1212 family)
MDLLTTLLDLLLWPALWLSALMGAACGLLFHLWRGGGWRRLGLDLVAGALGFGVGQLAADLFGNIRFMIGEVQVIPGLVAALAALLITRRLVVARPAAL